MSLPEITIPFDLPVDIPTLLHPAVVHFVIAIPIIVLLLEIINIFVKKRAYSVFSLILLILLMVAMAGAYFTGTVDGKEAYSLLSPEAQSSLKEHKLLGTYLVYISAAMILLKILFMAFSQVIARLFFIFLLLGFIGVILLQGKEGGDLVYKYGVNSEAVADVLSNKEDLQDEYNELKEECKGKAPESKKEETKVKEDKAPAPQEETKTETSNTTSETQSESNNSNN